MTRNNGSRPYQGERNFIMTTTAYLVELALYWQRRKVDIDLRLELTNAIQANQRLLKAIKEKEKEWKQ